MEEWRNERVKMGVYKGYMMCGSVIGSCFSLKHDCIMRGALSFAVHWKSLAFGPLESGAVGTLAFTLILQPIIQRIK